MIRAILVVGIFVRLFMGAPLRIPTVKWLPPTSMKVALNAAIVLDTQFADPNDVRVDIEGKRVAATVAVGEPFGPGVQFNRYLLVHPPDGGWPAAARLRVQVEGPTPPFSAVVETMTSVAAAPPRVAKFESPTLEHGPVYSGEVYERTLLRIRHAALDDTAGPIMRVTLHLIDRQSGDRIDASGYVPTAKSGSLLVESDRQRCIVGGEIVDVADNRSTIPKPPDCGR